MLKHLMLIAKKYVLQMYLQADSRYQTVASAAVPAMIVECLGNRTSDTRRYGAVIPLAGVATMFTAACSPVD